MKKKTIALVLCIGLMTSKSFASVGATVGPLTASALFFSVSTVVAIRAWKNKKVQPSFTQADEKNPLLPIRVDQLGPVDNLILHKQMK